MKMDDIRLVDLAKADLSSYQKYLSDCVVLTHDNRLYMQRRPENWGRHAGVVNIFGGHVEQGETPAQAVIRELNEETGARINEKELLFIGAVTEGWTNHKDLVHIYFWHDKNNTIKGCYEAESISFVTPEEAMAHPRIMDYARWALQECQKRGLI